METNSPDILIIDTDTERVRSFRRVLKDARPKLHIDTCSDPDAAHETVIRSRPTVALLHTSFPYMSEDGTGLVELLDSDFRAQHTGVILVLPISGSALYRSGCQEGLEFLDMANDLITTDFTNEMIQSVVLGFVDRRAEKLAEVVEEETVTATEPAYSFISNK